MQDRAEVHIEASWLTSMPRRRWGLTIGTSFLACLQGVWLCLHELYEHADTEGLSNPEAGLKYEQIPRGHMTLEAGLKSELYLVALQLQQIYTWNAFVSSVVVGYLSRLLVLLWLRWVLM